MTQQEKQFMPIMTALRICDSPQDILLRPRHRPFGKMIGSSAETPFA